MSCSGVIPARAGEGQTQLLRETGRPGHPRSRGGGEAVLKDSTLMLGSSPLARGREIQELGYMSCSGAIPARAGEGYEIMLRTIIYQGHPRSRGGGSKKALFLLAFSSQAVVFFFTSGFLLCVILRSFFRSPYYIYA